MAATTTEQSSSLVFKDITSCVSRQRASRQNVACQEITPEAATRTMNNRKIVVCLNAPFSDDQTSEKFKYYNFQHINSNNCSIKEKPNFLGGEEKVVETCDSLLSNDQAIKDRLKFIGEQLVQFIKLEDYHPIRSNLKNQQQHLKVKTIWNIYLKLLRAGPLDLYWNYKRSNTNSTSSSYFRDGNGELAGARQQVLSLIEGLNGYCDSINKLRLILKCPTTIAVLSAYEDIVEEIEGHRFRVLTKQAETIANNQSEANSKFREWSV